MSWNFDMCVVCVKLYNIYTGVLDNSKIIVFRNIYFGKIKILILGGPNFKISKIRDIQIVGRFTSFGVYGLCFATNVHILEACNDFPLFDPKSRNMTSLKLHFQKKNQPIFLKFC